MCRGLLPFLNTRRCCNTIDNVLRKSQLSQISEPTAMEESSLEGHHNGVHIWVDGLMNAEMYKYCINCYNYNENVDIKFSAHYSE
jgi:hypothetical protein